MHSTKAKVYFIHIIFSLMVCPLPALAAKTNKFHISTLVQATSCEVDRAH